MYRKKGIEDFCFFFATSRFAILDGDFVTIPDFFTPDRSILHHPPLKWTIPGKPGVQNFFTAEVLEYLPN